MLQRALPSKGRQAGLHGLHVVLHLGRRLVERAGVSFGDVRLHLAAEPEAELAPGVLCQLPGDLRRDHRAAREGDRNAGREMQGRRRQRCGRDVHPRHLVAFGEQHAGKAGRFRAARQVGHMVPGRRARHDIEFHGLLPYRDASECDAPLTAALPRPQRPGQGLPPRGGLLRWKASSRRSIPSARHARSAEGGFRPSNCRAPTFRCRSPGLE